MSQRTSPRKAASQSPWDIACRWPALTRVNFAFGNAETIDPGVNFFVAALEALGARTRFSCEGHPTGFYVAFEAPYELALRIRSVGYFNVEIEGDAYWSIRKSGSERPGYTEADKRRHLALASEAWVRAFGQHLAQHPMFAGPAQPATQPQPVPQPREGGDNAQISKRRRASL